MDNALQLLKKFCQYDFIERDCEKALSLLSDDICWFGTSNHEDVHGLAEARAYITKAIRVFPTAYSYTTYDEVYTPLCDNSGVAFLRIDLTTQGVKVVTRITAASRWENGRAKLCTMHFSVGDSMQKADEYFPLINGKEKIAQEKQDLVLSTMAGGLIGCYLTPGFPLYTVNSRMLDYLGYKDEEEFSLDIKGLIINSVHPADRDFVTTEVTRQVCAGSQYTVDYRLRKQNGNYIWVHDIGRKTVAENGAAVLISVCYDITAEHNKQVQLDNIINALPGGVALYRYVNDDLKIIYQSKGVGKLSSRSKNEYTDLIQKSAWDSIYKEDLPRVKAAFKKAAAGDMTVSLDYRVPDKNGGIVWINGSFRRTAIENNIPIIHAVFSEMPQLRELLRDMVENSHVAMIVSDIKTKELLYVNKAALAIRPEKNAKSYEGQLCYEYLRGRDKPCPGCRSNNTDLFENYSREIYISDIGKYYITQGRITNWAGRKAHIEYLIDVTDDRLMVQKLAVSEKTLDAAAEAAGLWYWRYNPVTDQVYYNERIQKDFNLPAIDEKFPQSWLDCGFLLKDYYDVYRQATQKIKDGVPKVIFEAQVKFKDGVTHWGEFRFTSLPKVDGEDRLAVCTARMIDLEKSLEAKYELERQKPTLGGTDLLFHAVFNLETGKTQEYVSSQNNQSLLAKYPTMKQAIAHFRTTIVGTVSQQELCELNKIPNLRNKLAKGNTTFSADYRRKMPNGKIIWVRNVFSLILEPNTKELLLFEYCYDIHTHKMSEEILRLTGKHDYQRISCIDFRRGVIAQYGEYADVSTNQEISYDLSRSEFVYKHVPCDKQAAFLQAGSASIVIPQVTKNRQYEFTSNFYRKDGTLGVIRIRFIPYDEKNKIYIATREDVTELLREEEVKTRQMEEALAVAQEANNAKSDFLSSMSHDMRTPLNAIIGMCELGIADIKNPQQVQESLTSIQVSSHLLLSQINNILDMNRIESGNLVMKDRTFSLIRELQNAETSFRNLAQERGLTFQMSMNITHDICSGDAAKFHSAFDNILSNAIKYTPKGGSVKYLITEHASKKHNIGNYRFEITDTGIGMDAETQKHIFEPFYRSEDTLNAEGTGLGLSISKAIIDLKGGVISVHSIKGKGSTFVVFLPIPLGKTDSLSSVQKTSLNALDNYDLSQAHILLCEDHPVNQKVAVKLLERAGATVTVANDGQKGLDIFLHSPVNTFNIILMDIRMPNLDGYQATTAIRTSKHPQAKTIPIVAMTANAFAEDVQKSLLAGMNDHLAKPIMPNVLYKTVLHYISNSGTYRKISVLEKDVFMSLCC